jgi:TonB family protein
MKKSILLISALLLSQQIDAKGVKGPSCIQCSSAEAGAVGVSTVSHAEMANNLEFYNQANIINNINVEGENLSWYEKHLIDSISKNLDYPRIAQILGQQGTVKIKLEIDKTGNLLSYNIVDKSVYPVLNNKVIEATKNSAPFAEPPSQLKNDSGNFTVTVPIQFIMKPHDNFEM